LNFAGSLTISTGSEAFAGNGRARDRLLACSPDSQVTNDVMTRLAIRIVLVGLVGSLAIMSTGCAAVAPYERGRLAHRTMTTADLAGPAEAHARAIQEGATGGSFEAGGGCGCN